ncbi:hypothetical protein CR152_15840 [Massilia violaceinigra]|uniref:Uncharacterized protein n=2 Tax=Massilia violaceinigra TaxID=2045208 RepID=A0A2D2DVC0_9BURK|nr:hypothetical protein CR152_15840 [Massilia violaceinigra]
MNGLASVDPGFAPPASAWVRFLRSYGPTPNNLNLFDEYITGALNRAKVAPITLSSPQLDKIVAHVQSGARGGLLIAGTAGDGKTYHCRGLWAAVGGAPKAWADANLVKELTLPDGRVAVFVKDLSELRDEQSDEVLMMLERCALEGDDSKFMVIAANHGQMLERLRDLGHRQGREHPLRKPLQDAFLSGGNPPGRLALFDLSRIGHRDSLVEVVRAVSEHSEWKNCSSCSLQADGRVCPIFENRRRLLGGGGEVAFVRRLGDLVDIARLNGWHLPVRDLLALTSNMILGHPLAKEGLMACADIPKIQADGSVEQASLYGNVFGANLPARRAMERPVFKALASFGIGEESTSRADGLLVYGHDDGKLAESFARLVGSDQVYGATPGFLSALERYLEGEETARLESETDEFMERLVSQRRRLFFTLPDGEAAYPYWGMTAFRFGGDYLDTIAALAERKPISDSVRSRLVRGLNRVMTGLLIENTDNIFVASSGGFTQSRVSVLCDTEVPAKRDRGTGMMIKLDKQTDRACLDIALAPGVGNAVSFSLSPIRFEFLCRVAIGALPGSFSNECLEDMLAFKAKLLRKAEVILDMRPAGEDDEAGIEDHSIKLRFIEIEQHGLGFSRPVTVRISA